MKKRHLKKRGLKKKNFAVSVMVACVAIGAITIGDSAYQKKGLEAVLSALSDYYDSDDSASDYSVSDYEGDAYEEINDNRPFFRQEDMTTEPFEKYSETDWLGRCGVAYANICRELMPTEERGEIGSVTPSGWHTVKYPGIIPDLYLYNRCHLIGYQLAGENANEKNLITGTRYLNVNGMLPFENQVAEYVRETGNHVLYRVTPEFSGNNLVADGVLMEAYSVEDSGEGVCFCVFVYNVQPGIEIDYGTGESGIESSGDKTSSAIPCT